MIKDYLSKLLVLCSFLFLLVQCKEHKVGTQMQRGLLADSAMVVSARVEASAIGISILKKGGNAFDAMIATHLALVVAYPFSGNIGGGNETTIMGINEAMLIAGMVIHGDPKGDHYGPVSIGKPDERVREQCQRRGRRIADLTKKLLAK